MTDDPSYGFKSRDVPPQQTRNQPTASSNQGYRARDVPASTTTQQSATSAYRSHGTPSSTPNPAYRSRDVPSSGSSQGHHSRDVTPSVTNQTHRSNNDLSGASHLSHPTRDVTHGSRSDVRTTNYDVAHLHGNTSPHEVKYRGQQNSYSGSQSSISTGTPSRPERRKKSAPISPFLEKNTEKIRNNYGQSGPSGHANHNRDYTTGSGNVQMNRTASQEALDQKHWGDKPASKADANLDSLGKLDTDNQEDLRSSRQQLQKQANKYYKTNQQNVGNFGHRPTPDGASSSSRDDLRYISRDQLHHHRSGDNLASSVPSGELKQDHSSSYKPSGDLSQHSDVRPKTYHLQSAARDPAQYRSVPRDINLSGKDIYHDRGLTEANKLQYKHSSQPHLASDLTLPTNQSSMQQRGSQDYLSGYENKGYESLNNDNDKLTSDAIDENQNHNTQRRFIPKHEPIEVEAVVIETGKSRNAHPEGGAARYVKKRQSREVGQHTVGGSVSDLSNQTITTQPQRFSSTPNLAHTSDIAGSHVSLAPDPRGLIQDGVLTIPNTAGNRQSVASISSMRSTTLPKYGSVHSLNTIGGESMIHQPDRTFDNCLMGSLCATIICFFPTGIFAIKYSSKSREAYVRGDYAEGMALASKAKMYVAISIGVGLLLWIVGFIVLIVLIA